MRFVFGVKIMKAALYFASACAAFFACVETASAQITVSAFSTIQPAIPPLSNIAAWRANGIYALENGLTSYGNPNLPTYFSMATQPIFLTDVVTTRGANGFNSWRGNANPSAYGDAFTNQFGNRLNFGALITAAAGTTFNIGQLSFQATSSDAGNALGFTAANLNYGFSAVGWISNVDGSITYVTSGENTTEVNGLYLLGFGTTSGTSFAIDSTSPGDTYQDKINNVGLDYGIASGISVNGVFSLTTDNGIYNGASAFDIAATPEPSAAAFMGLGLAIYFITKRAKKITVKP
jgi:hypothetical protein